MLKTIDTETAWAIIVILCIGTFLICMVYFAVRGGKWNGYANALGPGKRETLRFSTQEVMDIMVM